MMRALLTPLALMAALFLAGCGFTPMHATSSTSPKLADVAIDMKKVQNVADNEAGFLITQRLRDRIGVASSPAQYSLEIIPKYRRSRLGLTDGDVASRYDVTIIASWQLIHARTGKVADRGQISTVSTFGAPIGAYGVITADNVGVEQAAKATADKLVIEIARSFAKEEKRKAAQLKQDQTP